MLGRAVPSGPFASLVLVGGQGSDSPSRWSRLGEEQEVPEGAAQWVLALGLPVSCWTSVDYAEK